MEQLGHLFISHAASDDDFAQQVSDSLEAAGIRTWLDKAEMREGDAWQAQVSEALRSASGGLVLLSAASANSPLVASEYRYFLVQNMRLYVALIDTLPTHDIPQRLLPLAYFDFTVHYEAEMAKLVQAIKTGEIAPARSFQLGAAAKSRVRLIVEWPAERLEDLGDFIRRLASIGVRDIKVTEVDDDHAE
jgi:hypothetical protein